MLLLQCVKRFFKIKEIPLTQLFGKEVMQTVSKWIYNWSPSIDEDLCASGTFHHLDAHSCC